ncbi:MAG: hypothetical protein KGS61_06900 [Verrucomicrobia bacterium]|nr:hypothetical protein [Verrucomicrobiota bacterium]
MPEVANFVWQGSKQITASLVEKVLRQLPLWKVEFTQIHAPRFPHLVDQLEFLANAVEDFAEGVYKELPYVAVAEAVFALLYAHRKIDLIPDDLPPLAHADDSSIVRAVLIHNERAFERYAASQKFNWARVTSAP